MDGLLALGMAAKLDSNEKNKNKDKTETQSDHALKTDTFAAAKTNVGRGQKFFNFRRGQHTFSRGEHRRTGDVSEKPEREKKNLHNVGVKNESESEILTQMKRNEGIT